MKLNPYAPASSEAVASGFADASDAESIRRKYLSHEASLKSVGFLYLLGAVPSFFVGCIWMISGIAAALGYASNDASNVPTLGLSAILLVMGLVVLVIGILQGYAGWCLRTLNPSGKIAAIVVACFGLLGIPIGTLISVYILRLILSTKGDFVLSRQYKAIIEATPHIRYKTSIVVWILLLLVLVVVISLVVIALLAKVSDPRA